MFDVTSRYYLLATLVEKDATGRQVMFKARRTLPQHAQVPISGYAATRRFDRLDLVAARTLGDPELFWRICDANGVLNPLEFMANMPTMLAVGRP